MSGFDPMVTIYLPENGASYELPVNDFTRATPMALLKYLQQQGALAPDDARRPYQVNANGEDLAPTVSLATQNVGPGATLRIQREGTGA